MKKLLKIFGIIMITFIVITIVGVITSTDSTTTKGDSTANKADKLEIEVVDSVQLKEQKRIKDSIALVKKTLKEKAIKDLKSFRKNADEFEGSAFYRDSRAPRYTNTNFIFPYIGERGNAHWLRLKFQYYAEDWLFIKEAILLVDGEKFTVTGRWERDNASGKIWEWLDMNATDNEVMILEKIANSKTAKVRYIGNQYHDDRTITSKEKSIIKKTLEIYKNL